MGPTIKDVMSSEEFEISFSKALASSCVHFNSNVTCNKKPKTYLGMFSLPCTMYNGEKCDAFGNKQVTDLDLSLTEAKEKHAKRKL